MKNTLKVSTLAAAILAASPAMAGGFDKSDHSFDILFGDDNVITTSFSQTAVNTKGTANQMYGGDPSIGTGTIVSDIISPEVALRLNAADNVTCALKVEEPYGAEVGYADDSLVYDIDPGDGSSVAITAPIATKYESQSLTVGCGYDFALSTGKFTVLAGPKIQSVKGFFSEDLSSQNAGSADNLEVELDAGTEVGYILGAAYSIPEIALRASIIYHSQIDYSATGTIDSVAPLSLLDPSMQDQTFTTTGKTKTFTPQSVELALQSGVAENTLAFVNVRWSEYSKLSELNIEGDGSVALANAGGASFDDMNALAGGALTDLIDPSLSLFHQDTLDVALGMGRQLTDKLAIGASYSASLKLGSKSSLVPDGADSDNVRVPASETQTFSFGGEYAVTREFTVNGGLAYTLLDSYTAEDPDTNGGLVVRFGQAEATSFQLGMSYAL